ncbi:MAG TPA: TIGR01777 family oxidoreductase [Candidatus Acidoferrum sp.]|nr:TIGR01777 family oxidoreductase [Candidatus Acidoferrum sp.]
MRILISGASGLVGTHLRGLLEQEGHTVGRLVRPGAKLSEGDVCWDPIARTIDTGAIDAADAFVHLSGASIASGRWTPARKAVLRSSRVNSTRILVDALAGLRHKPKAFVCASAIGYYGHRGEEILTESSEPGEDFLAKLAQDWEAEAMRAEHADIRTVRLRFGIILAAQGGAFPRMLLPFKLGAGGRFGNGRQWMSWIALEDAVRAARLAIVTDSVSGPVNVVSPNPVRNAEFAHVLAGALGRPAIFPAPAFLLRIALGEMADPLLLASQRVEPKQLLARNFAFHFADFSNALKAML